MTDGAARLPPTESRRQPSGMRRVVWSMAAIVLVVVGLFGVGMFQAINACACSRPAETPELPGSPVEGVVVAVDSAGLGRVSGFTLRAAGGFAFDMRLGALENATVFSPAHLAEHMATSEPIRVYYRLEGTTPVVYRLEDASESPALPT